MCQLHQRQGYFILLDGRHIAIGAQQARYAGTIHNLTCKLEVERRQDKRLVIDDFHRRAAMTEHNNGTECRIVGDSQNELSCLRPQHHRLHHKAIDLRIWTLRFRARENTGGSCAHGVGIRQIQDNAPNVGFMRNVTRQHLEHDGRSLCDPRHRMSCGFFGVGGHPSRNTGNPVGIEHAHGFDRIEPLPPLRHRRTDDAARRFYIRHEFLWQAWRNGR